MDDERAATPTRDGAWPFFPAPLSPPRSSTSWLDGPILLPLLPLPPLLLLLLPLLLPVAGSAGGSGHAAPWAVHGSCWTSARVARRAGSATRTRARRALAEGVNHWG